MRGGNKYLNGSLDEVRIYNRPLSGQDVIDLANEQSAAASDSLVLLDLSSDKSSGAVPIVAASTTPGLQASGEELDGSGMEVVLPAKAKSLAAFANVIDDAGPAPADFAFEDSEFVDSLGELETLALLGESD
jgi:hypothetical protein